MEIHATGDAEPAYGIEVPIYRVQFWEQPAPGYAHNLDAFVLVGASGVEEALKWASDNARGRVWELLLEIEPEPVGAGLQLQFTGITSSQELRSAARDALRLYAGGMGSFQDAGTSDVHSAITRLGRALRQAI